MNSSLLGKVFSLHRREWAELFAAQTALLRAQRLIWTRRPGRLVTPVQSLPDGNGNDDSASFEVRRLAVAVSRAARHGLFRPSCLVRAVALHTMLQTRGFSESSLHIGVRRGAQHLQAHAWVEYRGLVLGDEEWRVKQFAKLARMGMSPGEAS
jgi:hypothetical protein